MNAKEKKNLDSSRFEDWARHFDTLLWSGSALFASALFIMLSINNDQHNFWIALMGYFLTIIAIYFATSFRELRFKMENKFDIEIKKSIRRAKKISSMVYL